MLHNDIVVKVTNLGKAYKIGLAQKKEDNLVSAIANALLAPIQNFKKISALNKVKATDTGADVFWANRNITFELKKGEVLGIIGKNGAGKSTLLKMLSRITEPTEGRIELHGRIASLLEVGTGFNPELTGRENIFLNGTILGLTKKEIENRYNSIVEFSGIEKFIETPVKRYSSGMKVRLAFAVAAHLDPEILIIDEVLAVGDAEFQKKCIGKMQDVAGKEGRTVLFVSHDMAAVKKLCTKAMLLSKGTIIKEGTPSEVVDYYLYNADAYKTNNNQLISLFGNKKFIIKHIAVLDQNQKPINIIESGQNIFIQLDYYVNEPGPDPIVIINIKNNLEQIITTCLSRNSYAGTMKLNKQGSILCYIPKLPLMPGVYTLDITLKYFFDVTFHVESAYTLEVEKGDYFGTGKINNDMVNGLFINHSWIVK